MPAHVLHDRRQRRQNGSPTPPPSNTGSHSRWDTSGGGLTGVSCTGPTTGGPSSTKAVAPTTKTGSHGAPRPGGSGPAFTACRARAHRSAPRPTDGGNGEISDGGRWKVAAMGLTPAPLACPVDGFCRRRQPIKKRRAVRLHMTVWSAVTGSTGIGHRRAELPVPRPLYAADRQDKRPETHRRPRSRLTQQPAARWRARAGHGTRL